MSTSPIRIPQIDDYFIPDGFIYNAAIRPALPYDFRGLALQRMRALRLSTYKPYIHCTRTFQIAPFTNVVTQIRMLAGTYLWGYWLWNAPSPGVFSSVEPHTIYVKVTDGATGSGPFGDWISDQDLGCFPPANAAGIGYLAYPQLLIEPYVVTDPGMFSVEFSNNGNPLDGISHQVQMQFMASVPCDRPQNAVDLGDCI